MDDTGAVEELRRGWQEYERTACTEVADGRIASLDLSCAGFRPSEPRR